MASDSVSSILATAEPAGTTETGLDTPGQPLASIVPETFIPVDRKAVIERILEQQFDDAERPLASTVVKYISVLRQAESARMLDEITAAYDAFNPDDETVNKQPLSPAERRLQLETLKGKIVKLVKQANYIEITQEDLREILIEKTRVSTPAEVDLTEYDFHMLYYRGEIKDSRKHRDLRTLWLWDDVQEVHAYRRLFLALKLKPQDVRLQEILSNGEMSERKAIRKLKRSRNKEMLEGVSEHTLHLKLFRRIARVDLRILFPNARITFSLFDQLMLWIGSGGSTLFAIIMATLKFVAAVAISIFFIVITLAGAIGAIIRSVTNFFNTRTRYMAKLAKSLYFHNLGSNQSVLALLCDDAEEEDIKETILTYCFLLKHGDRGLDTTRFEIEKFVRDQFDVHVKFDIEDGYRKLEYLGLLVEEDGHTNILSLDRALESMKERWAALPASQ